MQIAGIDLSETPSDKEINAALFKLQYEYEMKEKEPLFISFDGTGNKYYGLDRLNKLVCLLAFHGKIKQAYEILQPLRVGKLHREVFLQIVDCYISQENLDGVVEFLAWCKQENRGSLTRDHKELLYNKQVEFVSLGINKGLTPKKAGQLIERNEDQMGSMEYTLKKMQEHKQVYSQIMKCETAKQVQVQLSEWQRFAGDIIKGLYTKKGDAFVWALIKHIESNYPAYQGHYNFIKAPYVEFLFNHGKAQDAIEYIEESSLEDYKGNSLALRKGAVDYWLDKGNLQKALKYAGENLPDMQERVYSMITAWIMRNGTADHVKAFRKEAKEKLLPEQEFQLAFKEQGVTREMLKEKAKEYYNKTRFNKENCIRCLREMGLNKVVQEIIDELKGSKDSAQVWQGEYYQFIVDKEGSSADTAPSGSDEERCGGGGRK